MNDLADSLVRIGEVANRVNQWSQSTPGAGGLIALTLDFTPNELD